MQLFKGILLGIIGIVLMVIGLTGAYIDETIVLPLQEEITYLQKQNAILAYEVQQYRRDARKAWYNEVIEGEKTTNDNKRAVSKDCNMVH